MWVKICANTNLEDARLAADLGADAVGFVFAESARQVTVAQVAEIVSKLPVAIEKIGVFSSQDAAEIARIVRETGLTGVQLHGGFDLALARRLDAEFGGGIGIIQVLHWRVGEGAASATRIMAQLQACAGAPSVYRVLIDAKTESEDGGTGQRFDWAAAQPVFAAASGPKLIVAGGLNPDNVASAITQLQPWGVDVASGVEALKGRKDPDRLRAFVAATRIYRNQN